MTNVGKRIKELRQKKSLRQKDLAKLIQATAQKVSNWEREYTAPTHDDIARLSKALETSSDYILFGRPDGSKKELPHNFMELMDMLKSLPVEDQKKFYEMAKFFVAGLKADK